MTRQLCYSDYSRKSDYSKNHEKLSIFRAESKMSINIFLNKYELILMAVNNL